MDAVTKNLLCNQFNLPREIMELIEIHLINIYNDDHRNKFPMYDGSDFQYLIDRIYNIRCCISGYDENFIDCETEDDNIDYLGRWEQKCCKLRSTFYNDIKEIVIHAQYKLDHVNKKYW
jgi:hypothetical protein